MIKRQAVFFTLILLVVFMTACSNKSATDQGEEKSQQSDVNTSNDIDYPENQIEIIVPFAAGGGTDAVARALAESLKPILDEEVVVVNREGGSGANGMSEGLNSNPDGYTLTLVTREVAALPLLGIAPFETKDFKYVANVNEDSAVVVVPGDSSYSNIQDLIDDIDENPGSKKFAASVVPNYYGIQFSEGTDIDFTTVPYQGAAPAITEILGGGADFGIYNPGEVKQYVDSGDLKPLAVMAEERIEIDGFSDVPTFEEEGYDDIVSGTYRGIAVPKETPEEVVQILSDAIKEAVESDTLIDFMNDSSLGVGYYDAEGFEDLIENDIEALTPIIEIAKEQEDEEN